MHVNYVRVQLQSLGVGLPTDRLSCELAHRLGLRQILIGVETLTRAERLVSRL